MRVNLSYSVELEELLGEISSLYLREKNKLNAVAETSHRVLKEKYTDKNLSEIVLCIDEYRRGMTSFDIKLSEMENILKGYISIKTEVPEEPSAPATQELENNE